jgi:hypothetical protein
MHLLGDFRLVSWPIDHTVSSKSLVLALPFGFGVADVPEVNYQRAELFAKGMRTDIKESCGK